MTNFYLLYGDNKTLLDKEIDSLKLSLQIDSSDITSYSIDEVEDIIEEAQMVSMFSPHKFILIDATTYLSEKKELPSIHLLEDYFEHYNPSNILVFISYKDTIITTKKLYKLINSKGKVQKLQLTEDYLTNYLINYLKEKGYQMSISDIKYFLSLTGLDINNITNEIDKLMLFKLEDKIITREDISSQIEENIDNPIYDLANYILKGDTKKAIKLYNEFIKKGIDPSQLLPTIATQIRLLFSVKRLHSENKSNEEIAKILEFKNAYRVKYLLNDSSYYSEEELLKYLKKLATIDRNIKLSLVDSKIALELFIAKKDM